MWATCNCNNCRDGYHKNVQIARMQVAETSVITDLGT